MSHLLMVIYTVSGNPAVKQVPINSLELTINGNKITVKPNTNTVSGEIIPALNKGTAIALGPITDHIGKSITLANSTWAFILNKALKSLSTPYVKIEDGSAFLIIEPDDLPQTQVA